MRCLVLAFGLALALPAQAHEWWIEPKAYVVAADATVDAGLFNGQMFKGGQFPFLPQNFVRFDLALGDLVVPVKARLGDLPALSMPPLGNGLHVAIYESAGDVVLYKDFAVFTRFVEHKDFPGALARHRERGLPETGFREFYTRYAKALIAVGSGAGQDRAFGLTTEIVALKNPYVDDIAAGLPVQVFYLGAPRADAQVELFAKDPAGIVTVTLHRTDAEGVAVLAVVPGTSYLADAVVLREPDADTAAAQDAVWESLWAALTFAVPE